MIVYSCEGCSQIIEVGRWRFECRVCNEYDLCVACYESTAHKDTHAMSSIFVEQQESDEEDQGSGEEEEEADNSDASSNEDQIVADKQARRKQLLSQFIDDAAEDESDSEDYGSDEDGEEDEDGDDDSFIANDEEVEQELVATATQDYKRERKANKRSRDPIDNEDEEEEAEELRQFTSEILNQHHHCVSRFKRLRKIIEEEEEDNDEEEAEEEVDVKKPVIQSSVPQQSTIDSFYKTWKVEEVVARSETDAHSQSSP